MPPNTPIELKAKLPELLPKEKKLVRKVAGFLKHYLDYHGSVPISLHIWEKDYQQIEDALQSKWDRCDTGFNWDGVLLLKYEPYYSESPSNTDFVCKKGKKMPGRNPGNSLTHAQETIA